MCVKLEEEWSSFLGIVVLEVLGKQKFCRQVFVLVAGEVRLHDEMFGKTEGFYLKLITHKNGIFKHLKTNLAVLCFGAMINCDG